MAIILSHQLTRLKEVKSLKSVGIGCGN
ncbi:hypothetical protein CCACVL1_22851 [Corchorus capsularis]|uniref:Uncharacterized protein n=1 Tax=Corchorus capsularis TaxID=210143 RepID=A0A1R3GW85_COCAP|nr:hypothetical protein CCACVL1_22851 [Corchorus capsularis]